MGNRVEVEKCDEPEEYAAPGEWEHGIFETTGELERPVEAEPEPLVSTRL